MSGLVLVDSPSESAPVPPAALTDGDTQLDFASGLRELRRAHGLGDLPILVLSHGRRTFSPLAAERSWTKMQRRLRADSSNALRVIADGSRHVIEADQPGLVATAVEQLAAAIRTGGRLRCLQAFAAADGRCVARTPSARACRSGELVKSVGFSAGAGVALGGFWITNRSSSTCAVGGRPRLRLYRQDGQRVNADVVTATRGNSSLPNTGYRPVLRPKQTAVAWIEWTTYCGSFPRGLFRFRLTLTTGVRAEAGTRGGIAKCYPTGRNQPGPGKAGLAIGRFSKPISP